jgi:16S rRNA (guanine527-N7)-methyltransferase
MDKAFRETLEMGIERLRLPVDARAAELLERFADRLLAWNRKVNLTAVTAPAEVAEKHIIDSLLLLGAIGEARTLLDIGSGAGLPGIPVACVRPEIQVTCCDSVGKKIAFVKAVAVELGLQNVRGLAVRATGEPERDGLPRAGAVVSRALADPEAWLPLGKGYLEAGGILVAMLGREADTGVLEAIGRRVGLSFAGLERFELPRSKAARAVARWVACERAHQSE